MPVGWFMAERVTKGPLCYQIRKSFFVQSPASKASYAAVADMLTADGMDSGITREIKKLFD